MIVNPLDELWDLLMGDDGCSADDVALWNKESLAAIEWLDHQKIRERNNSSLPYIVEMSVEQYMMFKLRFL